MKNSKLKGTIKKVERDGGLVVAEVEMVESSGKTVNTHYNFRRVYGMGTCCYLTWNDGEPDSEIHMVNGITQTCNCEGFKNGYLCRHARMAGALAKAGKL